jgi:hypothetical protein
VVHGAPFSLRVASDTALCTRCGLNRCVTPAAADAELGADTGEEAHAQGLVLLCSASVVGPGVELQLGCEADAWDVQHAQRWKSDAAPPEPLGATPTAFRMPEDAAVLFERCSTISVADRAD